MIAGREVKAMQHRHGSRFVASDSRIEQQGVDFLRRQLAVAVRVPFLEVGLDNLDEGRLLVGLLCG